MSFAPAQATKLGCPLQHCDFKDKAGSWLCCACKQGPNTQGWCTMPRNRLRRDRGTFLVEDVMTTCDHGCCKECIKFGEHALLQGHGFMRGFWLRTTGVVGRKHSHVGPRTIAPGHTTRDGCTAEAGLQPSRKTILPRPVPVVNASIDAECHGAARAARRPREQGRLFIAQNDSLIALCVVHDHTIQLDRLWAHSNIQAGTGLSNEATKTEQHWPPGQGPLTSGSGTSGRPRKEVD